MYKKIYTLLGILSLLSVLLLALAIFSAEEMDLDVWLHLKTGQWILENHRVPTEQLYSFLIQGHTWIDHSWLFQAIIYIIYSTGGINSLILLKIFILFGAIALLAAVVGKRAYSLLGVATLFCMLYLLSTRLHMRPELFSILFIASYLFILKKHAEDRTVFILVPMQLLWLNLHGYFILGPIMIFLFLLCQYIKRKAALPFDWPCSQMLAPGQIRRLSTVLIASILLSFLNPYGLRGALYPFYIIRNLVVGPKEQFYVSELMPIGINNIIFSDIYPHITLLITIYFITLLLSIRKADIFDMIISSAAIIAVSIAKRHQAIFSIVLSASIYTNLNNIEFRAIEAYIKKLPRYFIRGLILTGFVVIIAFSARDSWAIWNSYYIYDKDGNIKHGLLGTSKLIDRRGAFDFILENDIEGPIYNNMSCAAYTIWRLYPRHKIFTDGRTELYAEEFRHIKDIYIYDNWKALDDKYSFKAVILFFGVDSLFADIAKRLYNDRNWALVYFDNVYMVFVKDTPENKNIIKKYRIDLEKQLYPVPTEPKIEEAAEKKAEPVYYVVGADILLHMGFPEKALSLLEIAEKFRCPGYMLYIFKGACYFDMNEYSKALEEFLKALPYSGYNSAELYTNIGSCYGKLGNLEKALKYFNFALQVNPGDERAKKYIKMTQETLNKTMRSNGAL